MAKFDKMYDSKEFKVESYQPSEREFAGMHENKTDDYIGRRDRIQNEAASMVRKQNYRGRYE